MHAKFARGLRLLAFCVLFLGACQATHPQSRPPQGGDFGPPNSNAPKVPTGVVLVKGAWSSASDSTTPLPEGGGLVNNLYTNAYFGISYAPPPGWIQKYYGPPPSDSGYYVLAQFRPPYNGAIRGTILITAQDLFFTLTPAANAFDLINFTEKKLPADYKVERTPAPVTIAGHTFLRFDYFSPVAGLHWYVLATQIRCHSIQFIFTSSDVKLLEALIQGMGNIQLPAEASPILGEGGGRAPVCVKDYARDESILDKVDPVLTERHFNPIPVRIIIDKEGRVKHIHFLSAFSDQSKSISEALRQWRFRPYLRDGTPLEVETGVMFGLATRATNPASVGAADQ